MKWVWIYVAFPFGGALLGVLFHEVFYKKMQDSVRDTEEKDGILDQQEEVTHNQFEEET